MLPVKVAFFYLYINKNELNILILRHSNYSPKHLYSGRIKVSQTEKKQHLNQFYLLFPKNLFAIFQIILYLCAIFNFLYHEHIRKPT